jgi:hypothetical protein
MSFSYKNPTSTFNITTPWGVVRTETAGTNFSVLGVGGYMEVYNIDDLLFTIPANQGAGPVSLSANTIPVRLEFGALPFLPKNLQLYSDGISSGRRRLGMLVYVHETKQTYQFTIDDYETLWNAASGSTSENTQGYGVSTSTTGGQDFIDAWTGATIEGYNGVSREDATWKIFWGTDWQVTGGTVDYNSTGDLSLSSNSGNTVTISGLTTITGGTYLSGTSTLELYNNLGDTVSVTGRK